MSDFTIGVQLYTLREHTQTAEDLARTLQRVAEIGYKSVQVSGIAKGIAYQDIGKMLSDAGLTCGATHMGWDRFVDDLDGVIADHKAVNCPHAAIGGMPVEFVSVEGIKTFAEQFAPVAEKLAQAGLDFSYHNHNFEFRKAPDGRSLLEVLFEEIPGEQLKAEIDTYWITAGGGEPTDWLKKLAGRIPVVHFKDMVIIATGEGHWDQETRMAPVGEGNLNWPGIIDACRAGGVELAYVEQDDCYGRDPFECLESSYKFLTSMGLS
jgi:sugar phosphate isomerase/epimerase